MPLVLAAAVAGALVVAESATRRVPWDPRKPFDFAGGSAQQRVKVKDTKSFVGPLVSKKSAMDQAVANCENAPHGKVIEDLGGDCKSVLGAVAAVSEFLGNLFG